MRLQRKIFVSPDYYEGLNEAEAKWLENERNKIAKQLIGDRKKAIGNREYHKRGKIKGLLDNASKRLREAEAGIRGTYKGPGRYKYVKEAVNKEATRKREEELVRQALEKKAAEESAKKSAKNLAQLKTAGKIGLGVLGTGALVGLGIHAVKKSKEKSKQDRAKRSVLGEEKSFSRLNNEDIKFLEDNAGNKARNAKNIGLKKTISTGAKLALAAGALDQISKAPTKTGKFINKHKLPAAAIVAGTGLLDMYSTKRDIKEYNKLHDKVRDLYLKSNKEDREKLRKLSNKEGLRLVSDK